MPETFTTEAGRKAFGRRWAAPSTFAAGSGQPGASPPAGGACGKADCLMSRCPGAASQAESVPKPKCGFWRFAVA